MTDPVEITTQATQAIADSSPATHAGWAILGGIVLKVVEALAKLFGSRKERAEAAAVETDAAARLVDGFADLAEQHREDTQRVRAEGYRIAAERDAAYDERDSCREALRKMDQRVLALEDVHSGCAPRIAALEGEQATAKKMLADLMGITPTHNHTPDEVRAEKARKETR